MSVEDYQYQRDRLENDWRDLETLTVPVSGGGGQAFPVGPQPYRRDMWTDRGRGPSRWTDEHANSKPIAWETKQIFSINGEEYAVVVMYADCKVYWTSASDNRTQIISASFTGYSPKQNILYVKDIRKRNLIGGIGLVLRTIDLNVPLQTVDEYNRSLFGAERVFPPPIKDKELDEMFSIGENI